MSESAVDRYVECATADMHRNNRNDISYPCRKCKLGSLFDPCLGIVQEHLLMRGFMQGYTQWNMSNDEDDHEADGAAEAENGEEEGHEMGNEEATAQDDDGDQYGDQGDEQHVDEEDTDMNTPLTSVMQEPHLQDLLLNNMTTDARAADRRKSKLAQLEIDSNTPLYDAGGRDPEESRLRVTLDVLQMKAKHGWTDTSMDDLL